MTDRECIELLQWALPRLHMRWPGFRKVRGQVRKRIARRMKSLGLSSTADYRRRLEDRPDEWRTLDAMCRISISRFYRDRGVFDYLLSDVLPALAGARGEVLEVWSAGCGSGEEPYTVSLGWELALKRRFPGLGLHILATDSNPKMIERAKAAFYSAGCLKDLPAGWLRLAFRKIDGDYRLEARYRNNVELRLEDVREELPDDRFDLILCRNLVFTYFDEALQIRILGELAGRLRGGGALVIGGHERVPLTQQLFTPWSTQHGVFRIRTAAGS